MSASPSYPLFDPTDPVFRAHEGGKLGVHATQPLRDRADLSLLYTPGVADVSRAIAADPTLAARYTARANTVAVVTDGTAVLGLGDIGPLAALPVMEGKAVLFKHFAGVDAVPVCMETGTVDELVEAIVRIAPTYGGINLEDISAPRCFEIERQLQERLDIPVFHDDQHGTAIVVLAGLLNAARVVGRTLAGLRVVVSGAGAAGVAVTKLLTRAGVEDIVVCDSRGIIATSRPDLAAHKRKLAATTNPRGLVGPLATRSRGPTCTSGSRGARCPRLTSPGWRRTASSSRSPTRRRRWTPRSRAGMRRWWRRVARTTRTRSTTCSRSRGSSGARWTRGPPGHRGDEAGGRQPSRVSCPHRRPRRSCPACSPRVSRTPSRPRWPSSPDGRTCVDSAADGVRDPADAVRVDAAAPADEARRPSSRQRWTVAGANSRGPVRRSTSWSSAS